MTNTPNLKAALAGIAAASCVIGAGAFLALSSGTASDGLLHRPSTAFESGTSDGSGQQGAASADPVSIPVGPAGETSTASGAQTSGNTDTPNQPTAPARPKSPPSPTTAPATTAPATTAPTTTVPSGPTTTAPPVGPVRPPFVVPVREVGVFEPAQPANPPTTTTPEDDLPPVCSVKPYLPVCNPGR